MKLQMKNLMISLIKEGFKYKLNYLKKLLNILNNNYLNSLAAAASDEISKDLSLDENINIDLWEMESLVYPEPYKFNGVKLDKITIKLDE